jgi:ATP-dependent DNA helicase RecQ
VLALTATATPEVTRDIAAQLEMERPLLVRGSFFRRNLRIHAVKKGGGLRTRDAIVALARARPGQSGIVYALSRKSVEDVAVLLRDSGIRAAAYHAGLEGDVRAGVQDRFREGKLDVVVATVAFGMGIDKPDIRYVVHRDMPRSIEAYYQEIGRAGRDGGESACVLFYSWADVAAWDRLFEDGDPRVAAWQRRQARAAFRFADGPGCRHAALVAHFGERIPACGDACDRCTGEDVVAPVARVTAGERVRRRARKEPAVPVAASVAGSAAARNEAPTPPAAAVSDGDEALFQTLRAWRTAAARARGVPAYVVLHDSTLREIAARRPGTLDALASMRGVGPAKLAEHGESLLAAVAAARR